MFSSVSPEKISGFYVSQATISSFQILYI